MTFPVRGIIFLLLAVWLCRPVPPALGGAGSDVPPEQTGNNATAATVSLKHTKRDHVPAKEKTYKGLFCLDGLRHPGAKNTKDGSGNKTVDILKKDLEQTARKAILLEILNAHFAEQRLIKPAPLLRDEAVAPYLKTLQLGNMRYFNGPNPGEICLECSGRLDAADRKLLDETTVAAQGFCQPGNATLVKDLRSNATLDFMRKTLGKYNPKLFAARPEEAAMLAGELWLTNQTVNLDNLTYCMDAVARLVPYFATHYVAPAKPLFKPKKPVVVSKKVYALDLSNATIGDPLPQLGQGLVVVDTPNGKAVGLNAGFSSSLRISGQNLKGFNATVEVDWPLRFPEPDQDPVQLELVQLFWSNGVQHTLTIELPGPAPRAVVHYGRNGVSYPMPWHEGANRLTFIKSGDLLRIRCNEKSALTLKAGGNALGSLLLPLPEHTTVRGLTLSKRYIDYE
jgi:hypothetical protein